MSPIKKFYHENAKVRKHEKEKHQFESLSRNIIGAAIEVHRELGPGLLESAYEQCLSYQLAIEGLRFERQKPLPVKFKGIRIDCGYRLDLFVEGRLILELKAVANIDQIHEAQILTYMKLAPVKVGLLINFNVAVLRDGIRRFVL